MAGPGARPVRPGKRASRSGASRALVGAGDESRQPLDGKFGYHRLTEIRADARLPGNNKLDHFGKTEGTPQRSSSMTPRSHGMRPGRCARLYGLLLAAIWLAGCEHLTEAHHSPAAIPVPGHPPVAPVPAVAAPQPPPGAATAAQPLSPPPERTLLLPGTQTFTRTPAVRAAASEAASGDVTLNFENANIREVVKVILDDLLNENYLLDPRVQGGVTLQTSRPLPKDALVPTLELVLRMNGAALVKRDGAYHIVPRAEALSGAPAPQLGNSDAPLPSGFGIRIVPLEFIAATEMQKILEPLASPGNIVRVDTARNLLVLSGSSQELGSLLETVKIFDVDWLAGMSVGMFTPTYVEAKTLADELETLFGEESKSPLAGLVRLIPNERLNSLLVITPRREYLRKVATWIDRLDQDTGSVGKRLFIYRVQNGKATDLAEVLELVFASEEGRSGIPRPELAPGLEPVQISSTPAESPREGERERPEVARRLPPTGTQEGLAIAESDSIRIIADEINNALLIMASAEEYRQIEAALRRLDIVPLQVLIEATIAEITLTDELRYGLEWFFKNNLGGGRSGEVQLDLGDALLTPLVPGFSYAVRSSGSVRAVLNALASDSKLNIVSSPSLMVLNNQTANIQVGDEVSIRTQAQTDTGETAVLSTFERRDTGVILTVTPRVNAGGLVTMEIEQEVSGVQGALTETPTIFERVISSTVAVHSGETVVLGGLITESEDIDNSGIPLLREIPVLGALFGQTSIDKDRTELVVLITPRAVRDAVEAQQVTQEYYEKMESLKPLGGQGLSSSADETPPGSPAPKANAREL